MLQGTDQLADHHRYIIDLWKDLLSSKSKEHRLLSLHVLIHFRHRDLERVTQLFAPLNAMRDYCGSPDRPSADSELTRSDKWNTMAVQSLVSRPKKRGKSDTGSSLNRSFSGYGGPDTTAYTPAEEQMSPCSSSTACSSSTMSGAVSSDVTATTAELDAHFYCEMIMAQLNRSLMKHCDSLGDDGRGVIIVWSNASQGVVSGD